MIKIEEVRKLSTQFRGNSLQLNTELKLFGVRRVCQKDVYNLEHDRLDDFITQQEKVMELLELYRKSFTKNISNTNYEEWIILEAQIKKLESELNDNK